MKGLFGPGGKCQPRIWYRVNATGGTPLLRSKRPPCAINGRNNDVFNVADVMDMGILYELGGEQCNTK